jgi:electron transfer flavoprotein beta subunit
MDIVVPIRLVPDLVEEIDIADDEHSLDRTFMRFMVNEFDDHAIEEAVILKGAAGGTVTVMGLESDELDDVLYTSAAKGADRLIRITTKDDKELNNHGYAELLHDQIDSLNPDMVLTGVSAHDQFDGPLGALLAELLGWTYVGYVSSVEMGDGACIVEKEFPGGLIAKYEVKLPAVLGIQASENPPQYVAISKIRQAMKSSEIDSIDVDMGLQETALEIGRMYKPETGEQAEMLEGDAEAVAEKLLALLHEHGVL